MLATGSIYEYCALDRRHAQLLPHGSATLDNRKGDRYSHHYHRRGYYDCSRLQFASGCNKRVELFPQKGEAYRETENAGPIVWRAFWPGTAPQLLRLQGNRECRPDSIQILSTTQCRVPQLMRSLT